MSNSTPVSLSFDITTRIVTSRGRQLKLTPLEADVLQYVMERAGVFIPLVDLIVNVWGDQPDSYKTSYEEVIRNLIRRLQRELELPDILLVYQRKKLVCRLTPEAAAQIMVMGTLTLAEGHIEQTTSEQTANNSTIWPYTRTIELPPSLSMEMHSIDVNLKKKYQLDTREKILERFMIRTFLYDGFDFEVVRDSIYEIFMEWYNRLAWLSGIPNPKTAYQEGRFGPRQLTVRTQGWSRVLMAVMDQLIKTCPEEMTEFGKDTDHGSMIRHSFFYLCEDWRPEMSSEIRAGYMVVRTAEPFEEIPEQIPEEPLRELKEGDRDENGSLIISIPRELLLANPFRDRE